VTTAGVVVKVAAAMVERGRVEAVVTADVEVFAVVVAAVVVEAVVDVVVVAVSVVAAVVAVAVVVDVVEAVVVDVVEAVVVVSVDFVDGVLVVGTVELPPFFLEVVVVAAVEVVEVFAVVEGKDNFVGREIGVNGNCLRSKERAVGEDNSGFVPKIFPLFKSRRLEFRRVPRLKAVCKGLGGVFIEMGISFDLPFAGVLDALVEVEVVDPEDAEVAGIVVVGVEVAVVFREEERAATAILLLRLSRRGFVRGSRGIVGRVSESGK